MGKQLTFSAHAQTRDITQLYYIIQLSVAQKKYQSLSPQVIVGHFYTMFRQFELVRVHLCHLGYLVRSKLLK